ncbi:MAG TPA: methyltransferase domain-containing protein [Frankiaceae bacterium]|nr:methyltransferase domain-containing protein [Frankiaceae bacterium]
MPGDFDYTGVAYAPRRRPDPRIAAYVHAALGDARTVVNVGAGAGSYEPLPPVRVLAVEPSEAMVAQRPPGAAPVVRAVAEALPLRDGAVDAAMATITVHQWDDPARGLAELRRVARGPVAILTFDPDVLEALWLAEYAPELVAAERRRYLPIATLAGHLGGATVTPVPVPFDCVDGFGEAFYGRPEAFLDPGVRRAQSGWGFVAPEDEERAVRHLADDLASGAWDARHGALRDQPELAGSLRLVVSA